MLWSLWKLTFQSQNNRTRTDALEKFSSICYFKTPKNPEMQRFQRCKDEVNSVESIFVFIWILNSFIFHNFSSILLIYFLLVLVFIFNQNLPIESFELKMLWTSGFYGPCQFHFSFELHLDSLCTPRSHSCQVSYWEIEFIWTCLCKFIYSNTFLHIDAIK